MEEVLSLNREKTWKEGEEAGVWRERRLGPTPSPVVQPQMYKAGDYQKLQGWWPPASQRLAGQVRAQTFRTHIQC